MCVFVCVSGRERERERKRERERERKSERGRETVGVLLGDGAGRDVFNFTGGERHAPLAATPPADRGTV